MKLSEICFHVLSNVFIIFTYEYRLISLVLWKVSTENENVNEYTAINF